MKIKPTLFPHEFFDRIQSIEDRAQREAALKKHAYKQIKTILQLAYNDKIQLDLPEGAPPYSKNPEGKFPISRISHVFRTIGYCVKGNNIPRMKKEKWFIGILEQLHEEDAKILIAAKDKKFELLGDRRYSRISKSLVKSVFPEILD